MWGVVPDQALEGLRKLRTEKLAEAKTMKAELAHLTTHRDTAERLRGDAESGAQRAAQLGASIERAEQELRGIGQVGRHCLSLTHFRLPWVDQACTASGWIAFCNRNPNVWAFKTSMHLQCICPFAVPVQT